jgi:hypothetical protein
VADSERLPSSRDPPLTIVSIEEIGLDGHVRHGIRPIRLTVPPAAAVAALPARILMVIPPPGNCVPVSQPHTLARVAFFRPDSTAGVSRLIHSGTDDVNSGLFFRLLWRAAR